jgi:hypothetical protein
MEFFRRHIIGRLFAILTGLVFLNLSFVLTELAILEVPSTNSGLYADIAKLVSGVGFEEERDAGGESSEKTIEKEIDVYHQFENKVIINDHLITSKLFHLSSIRGLLDPDSKVATPPPKSV